MKKYTIFASVVFLLFSASGSLIARAADTQPPLTPEGIYASLTESNQVYVSWSPTTDNVGVVGYYLYRNGALIVNTPGYTYYTDTPGAGTYSYTVAAYDAAGNISAQSNPTPPVTVVSDSIPPSTPSDLTATNTSSSITLTWTGSTDNVAVVGYYIYRNGQRIITTNPIQTTSYTDNGLSLGNTYNYTVVAYDAAGNISDHSNEATVSIVFDVTPPSMPQGVVATAVSSNQINLGWQPSSDNIAVTGYTIYRNMSEVGTATSTNYQDIGLAPGTAYSYTISAYDQTGNNSPQSYAVVGTTLPPDVTPPSIPTQLSAVATSASTVNVSWRSSTDNTGVAGYFLYRNGTEIASTASTTYMDTGLTTSTTYTYAVKAYDAAGNISPQNSVAVTTLASNPVAVPPIIVYPTPAPPTPTPIVTPVTPASPTPATPPVATQTPSFTFTTALYFGMDNSTVQTLQTVLIKQGYLGAGHATGYFGALTQAAVQRFQCAKGIVCSGTPATTGYGFVGVRTRLALNSL